MLLREVRLELVTWGKKYLFTNYITVCSHIYKSKIQNYYNSEMTGTQHSSIFVELLVWRLHYMYMYMYITINNKLSGGEIKCQEADTVCSVTHRDVKYFCPLLSVLSLFRSITSWNKDVSRGFNVTKFTFKFFMMHLDPLHFLDIFLPWISDMKMFPDTDDGGGGNRTLRRGKKEKYMYVILRVNVSTAGSFINHAIRKYTYWKKNTASNPAQTQ